MEGNIPGIDFETGLSNVADDEDTYFMILNIFVEEYNEKVSILKESMDTNLKLFTTTVHGFKSSCRNIGAMDLGDESEKLEHAGKENNIDYIHQNIDPYLEKLKTLIFDIENYLN